MSHINVVYVFSNIFLTGCEEEVMQTMIQKINPCLWFEEEDSPDGDGFYLVTKVRPEDEGKVSLSDRCMASTVLNLIKN